MCEFCEGDGSKNFKILQRNSGADENICEDRDCDNCNGCSDNHRYFQVNMYNDFITLEYYLNINNKIVIDSASERISIKYCPMCGRKLGK